MLTSVWVPEVYSVNKSYSHQILFNLQIFEIFNVSSFWKSFVFLNKIEPLNSAMSKIFSLPLGNSKR